MPCIRIPGGVVTLAGPDRTIRVRGKRWTYEWDKWMGPTVLTKKGDPMVRQPGFVLDAIGKKERRDRDCKHHGAQPHKGGT